MSGSSVPKDEVIHLGSHVGPGKEQGTHVKPQAMGGSLQLGYLQVSERVSREGKGNLIFSG